MRKYRSEIVLQVTVSEKASELAESIVQHYRDADVREIKKVYEAVAHVISRRIAEHLTSRLFN